MSHEDWPSLEESAIKALATSKVFARGRALFDENALEELTRQTTPQGEKLSALCQGSDEEAYSLSVRMTPQGVQDTRCSCPYEYDGLCKHLVALLLVWAHTPEAFGEVEVTESEVTTESALFLELRSRERDELAHIVVQLVEAEPKLRPLVRRLLKTRLSDGDVAKTEKAVASQVRKVLRPGFEGSFPQIRRELLFHVRGAASIASLRPGDAIRLYVAVLRGLMAAGEDPFQWDEESELVDVSQQCVTALATLLPSASDSVRRVALDTLCQSYVFDLKLGGYGFAEGAESILEDASPEEWAPLEAQLNKHLEYRAPARHAKVWGIGYEAPHDIVIEPSSWGNAQILALKSRRIARWDGPQAATAFLIQNGTPEQQVDAHLSNRDFDQATRLALTHFARLPGLIHSFADKLNAAGEWARAREWAQKHQMTKWLAHNSALRGEPDALPLNVALFHMEPNVQHWTETLKLAPVEERDTLRAQLWQLLEEKKAFAVQFDICMREGEVQKALDIWPKLPVGARQSRHDQLATAAESCDVDIAVVLWSELAESLISHRSRDAYRLAVKALVKAKRLLEKAGRGAEWTAMGTALRTRYPTLRALKEELDRAKL